jgi:hypothetical protein
MTEPHFCNARLSHHRTGYRIGLTQEQESVDAVVQQILYHDLRDVVRIFDNDAV